MQNAALKVLKILVAKHIMNAFTIRSEVFAKAEKLFMLTKLYHLAIVTPVTESAATFAGFAG